MLWRGPDPGGTAAIGQVRDRARQAGARTIVAYYGGHQLKAAEGHEGVDGGFESPLLQAGQQRDFNALDPIVSGIDALEILFEDGFHGGMGQDQLAQVAHVRRTPVGLALVTVAVAQQEALEPLAAATVIIDGVGAGAAQIADGFIGGFGDIDGSEFPGPPAGGRGCGRRVYQF